MLSSCEMTNCLHHRRKWLSFVFIMFISNRFPSSSYAHNPQKRSVGPSDVNSTEIYLVMGFPVFSFLNLTTISVLFFLLFFCHCVVALLPTTMWWSSARQQGKATKGKVLRCKPDQFGFIFFSIFLWENIEIRHTSAFLCPLSSLSFTEYFTKIFYILKALNNSPKFENK